MARRVTKIPTGGSIKLPKDYGKIIQLPPGAIEGAPKVEQPSTKIGGTIINTPSGENIPVGGGGSSGGGGGGL